MRDASSNATAARAKRTLVLTVAAVFAIFVLALFLRTYWNIDAAATSEGFVLSAGSDPYYHKRAIDYIQQNGWSTLIQDPLLNYPYGAVNPNPPLFQWSVAVTGAALAPFFDGGIDEATWWAMLWSPAVWGALTIIPTYLIGRDVFGRGTGLVAAFLLGVSTTHIDHTALGAADHDAMLLFFAVSAFWMFIKSIQGFRGDSAWVSKWGDAAARTAGLKAFVAERRSALMWALGAGVMTAFVGLIWKGFPYLIGVFFAYATIQLVVDHWRSKDSLGVWLGTLITLLVGTVLVVPAYAASNVIGFLKPVWFLIAAHFAFGLIMVPTRDWPTILVLPAFAIAAALGVLASFFVVPDVARSLLYTTVYFKQTNLYQTIAEAHPATFDQMVFGIGPVAFFLAMFGTVWLFVSARKNPGRANLFMITWTLIALYMGYSAVRFLFNATPILAVLAGWTTVMLFEWLNFPALAKTIRNAPDALSGLRRGITGWQVTGATLVALFMVFPSVFLAVDASAPPAWEEEIVRGELIDYLVANQQTHNFTRAELEDLATGSFNYQGPSGMWALWFQERAAEKGITKETLDESDRRTAARFGGLPVFIEKRFGAFGQGYLPDYWRTGLGELAAFDDFGSAAGNVANRPAFLSWWDYGHWAIEVGKHPTVADNFQNGYVFAANFLLSQNETHAVQLLAARSIDLVERNGVDVRGLIRQSGVDEADVEATYNALKTLEFAPAMTLDKAVKFEEIVTQNTKDATRPDGVRIRYFATDIRMLPYDLPQTGFIEQSSIFYAPVTLADKDPDTYVELFVRGTDERLYTQAEFEERASQVTRHQNFGAAGQKYTFKQPFFDSMYYRGFVGTPVDARSGVDGDQVDRALQTPQPGFGMKHWRASIVNDQLRVLEYTPGARLTGTVEQGGDPVQGASVTVFDDAGALLWETLTDVGKQQLPKHALNVPHDSSVTDADGKFDVVLPFSTADGIAVRIEQGGVEIANHTFQVSRADANAQKALEHTFRVADGSVTGTLFFDRDGDGVFNLTNGDEPLANSNVTIADVTGVTNAVGGFTLDGVAAGSRRASIDHADFSVAPSSATVRVQGDTVNEVDIAAALRLVTLTGTAHFDSDGNGNGTAGEGAGEAPLTFTRVAGGTGVNATAQATTEGTYNARLTPGDYTVRANYTASDGTEYVFEGTLTVDRTSVAPDQTFDLLLTRRS